MNSTVRRRILTRCALACLAWLSGSESLYARVLDAARIVEMIGIGSQPEAAGLEGRESDVDVRSTDGRFSATVIRRGNLRTNANDYSLFVYDTSTPPHAGKRVQTLVRLSSSANESGISSLIWLSDHRTLAYLGVEPATGVRNVFTVDVVSGEVVQRTHERRNVLGYRVAADLSWVLMEREPEKVAPARMSPSGVPIESTSFLGDLLLGDWSGVAPVWSDRRVLEYAISGQGVSAVWRGPPCLESRLLAVSPDAGHALHLCRSSASRAKHWSGFEPDQWGNFNWLYVVDTESGAGHMPLSAPLATDEPTVRWEEGNSVAVGPVQGSHSPSDCGKRDLTAGHTVRLLLGERLSTVTACEDYRRVATEGAKAQVRGEGVDDISEARVESAPSIAPRPRVYIEHALNTPSKLVVETTRGREVLVDAGDGIEGLERVSVRVIRGQLPDGSEWVGGLYEPRGEAPYPLVIQTHGFNTDHFAPQGVTTSGGAAQIMALAGIAVVQLDDTFAIQPGRRRTENARMLEIYEAVITQLAREGLIDAARVGLQGWSITAQHVYYALQRGRTRFAAASVHDGQVGGYFEKVAVQNVHPVYASEGRLLYGADPEGAGLETWAAQSPGFNMHRVEAPVRIEANGLPSLIFCWEAYSNLLALQKPVELYLYPAGAHTLLRPAERLASMEATADWFRYWLLNSVDRSPHKTGQYARWDLLRRLQDSGGSN